MGTGLFGATTFIAATLIAGHFQHHPLKKYLKLEQKKINILI